VNPLKRRYLCGDVGQMQLQNVAKMSLAYAVFGVPCLSKASASGVEPRSCPTWVGQGATPGPLKLISYETKSLWHLLPNLYPSAKLHGDRLPVSGLGQPFLALLALGWP